MRAANVLGISIVYPAEMERCLAIVTGAHASGDFHLNESNRRGLLQLCEREISDLRREKEI